MENKKGAIRMSWRKELADYEASLFEEQRSRFSFLGPKKKGELEYKKYDDGEERLSIRLKGLNLPRGEAAVAIKINDILAVDMNVTDGSGYLLLRASHGDKVPPVNNRDLVVVLHNERILCSGKFHKD